MKIVLTGQVALVTGGGRGIEWSLQRDPGATGATVIINYRRSRDAAERLEKDIVGEGGQRARTRPTWRTPERSTRCSSSSARNIDASTSW